MKTADLITSFLSNEMTPEQERQFLISVAASDSLRLSLKSHVMLDRISAGQLNRAQVPVGVRDAIFAQMGASMAETPPVQTPAQAPSGMAGRFTGNFLRRYGNQAMALLLTAGGFAAGYFANLDGDGPAARQAITQQTVQTAPVQEQNAPSLQPGAQLPATTPASRTDAAPAPAGENIALREDRARTSETVRPAVTRQENTSRAVRAAQLRQRSVVSHDPLSDPLEPAGGMKTPEAPNAASNASTVAAGMSVEDSASAAKAILNQTVSVQTSIKKSSTNTTPVQEPRED